METIGGQTVMISNTNYHGEPVMPGFHMPILTHRMNMIMENRPRRRRSNHSHVATMDPVAVARRNERERNRVKQVNDGFDALRKRVPFLPDKKKFSKVEILRCAMMYIRDLKDIVEEYDCNNVNKTIITQVLEDCSVKHEQSSPESHVSEEIEEFSSSTLND